MAGAATDVNEWLSCVLKGMACFCFPQCLQTLTGKFLLIMPKCVERYLRSEIICTFFGACGVFLSFKEIPPDLVCDINRDCANTFIKFLLEKQKWPEVLLLLTRKVNGEPPLGDCLLKGCNFSDLDLCALIPRLSAWDPRRMQLLGCLIDGGGEKARDEPWRLVPWDVRPPLVAGLSLGFGDSSKCCPILFLGSVSFCNSGRVNALSVGAGL